MAAIRDGGDESERARPSGRSTGDFIAVIGAERVRLIGAAYLLSGNALWATTTVREVLAQVWERWPGASAARLTAWRGVVDAAGVEPPAPEPDATVESIDLGPRRSGSVLTARPATATAIPLDHAVAVLTGYAELDDPDVATILGMTSATVADLARRDSATRAGFAEQIPAGLGAGDSPATDLARGQAAVRRRRLRGGALIAAAAAALVATVSVLPTGGSEPRATAPVSGASQPVVVVTAPPSLRPACRDGDRECQLSTLLTWRQIIAGTVVAHLDPDGTHYLPGGFASPEGGSGSSRYEQPGFWAGTGGALGVDVLPNSDLGTSVFVQVATDPQYLVACGQTTGQTCEDRQFMDGNTFKIADGPRGIEVRYWSQPNTVVTVVVRQQAGKKHLKVTTSDVLELIQDERMTLPRR